MSKNQSHPFEYMLLRMIELPVRVLPRSLSLSMGASAGMLLYRSGAYRRIAEANMDHVGFPGGETRETVLRKLYQNVGRYFADFLRPPLSPPPYTVDNYDRVDKLFAQKKGIIVLLGHFGNWEILATIFGKKIDRLNVIAKPMKNTFVQQWLDRKRSATGVETIYVKQAVRKSLKVLRSNGMLAVLIDQYAGTQGSPAPFLGKEASTIQAVAYLAHKTGCGVLPTHALLQSDRSYHVTLENLEPPDSTSMAPEEAIRALQVQHNQVLSRWILEHPEHWFGWFHKRFRHYIPY